MNKNQFKKTFLIIAAVLMMNSGWAQDYSYSLEECIRIAYEKNLTIQRSKIDVKVSEVTKNQSRMERLPNFNMTANYGANWGRSIDPTTNTFITQQNNSSNINGQTNLTVFNGLQIANSIKQAHVNYEASEADLEKARNDVGLNVATLYLNVIFNQELLSNAQYQLNSTNQQLDRTKKLVDAGALPVTNLLDLQAQGASNEVNVINAENSYNLAILNLKQALLIPAGDPFQIEIPELNPTADETVLMTPEQIYETAEHVMPEIKSAQLRIEEADLNYKISRGAYMPTLTLSGGFNTNYSSFADQDRDIFDGTTTITQPIGYVSTSGDQVLTDAIVPNVVDTRSGFPIGEQYRENISKSVGVNLSIPVFNRFRTRAEVQRSMLSKYRAEVNSQEVKNQLRQSIESAYNDMIAASKTYTANQKQVEALEESFRVIENQYNLGSANYVDYQVANNNLYMAKSDLVRSKFDFIFKQKILDFYLGKSITF
ncbi:MAG: TolC family protein [Reichenbachiella sp.]|uniref:TolC family protein n=1 Tax=Reichenbachiella sp. TaxID=2184521 RepID=UPI003265797E